MFSIKDLMKVEEVQKCFFGRMILAQHRTKETRYLMQVVEAEEINCFSGAMKKQFLEFLKIVQMDNNYMQGALVIEEHEQGCYIVFPYSQHLTLFNELRQLESGYSEQICKRIAADILRFYFYFETRGGVIHHDIKLENIFFGPEGWKVGGLDMCESGSVSQTICGSPYYLAPEVHSALTAKLNYLPARFYTRKSDIYSLGLLLLEVFTQQSLYGAELDDQEQGFMSQIECLQERKSTLLSKRLSELISRFFDQSFFRLLQLMLKTDPNERPSFLYLYEYFGIYKPERVKPAITFQSDPNLFQVSRIRKIFFHRLNHEYQIILFMLHSSLVIWAFLSADFSQSEAFGDKLRVMLSVISFGINSKGILLLNNLVSSIKTRTNIFLIEDMQSYYKHPVSTVDSQAILHQMSSLNNSKLATHYALVLQFINGKLQQNNPYYKNVAIYNDLAGQSKPSGEKLQFLNALIAKSSQELRSERVFEFINCLFAFIPQIIQSCLQDDKVFKYVTGEKGLFDWESYLSGQFLGIFEHQQFQRIHPHAI